MIIVGTDGKLEDPEPRTQAKVTTKGTKSRRVVTKSEATTKKDESGDLGSGETHHARATMGLAGVIRPE
jgi:hypothetical protein